MLNHWLRSERLWPRCFRTGVRFRRVALRCELQVIIWLYRWNRNAGEIKYNCIWFRRTTAIPRGMWSNPTALYRLIGILHGCTRMEVIKTDIKTFIIRKRTSQEVHDIVSTIGDNGYRRPLASTKNNISLHISTAFEDAVFFVLYWHEPIVEFFFLSE